MENNVIHIGIIGLGAIGERLMNLFQTREDIVVSAICDTSKARLQEVAETFTITNKFTNYQDLLDRTEIDAVYVAVPPKFHEAIVLAAISAGKHILCEKPLANSVEEAERMVDAITKTNLVHAMHFPLNYQASLQQFEQLFKDGYIGELRRINLKMHFSHWPRLWQQSDWVAGREQGGYVLEVGVHWIQAIQRIFGKITEVRSQLHFPEDPSLCENAIIAEMKLENGTSVLIDGLSNIGGEEQLEFAAYGTDGTIMLRNWRQLLAAKSGEALQELEISFGNGNNLISEFVKAIHGEKAELYDFQNGYDAQVVLEALRHPINNDWQKLN
ncbi:gfo/Idh/MocA family oxidoreductase [Anaerobacillus alkaliphilus]|uniref:Gfo/Idh/MocA family oxidoreductase n=1 Tax=Anaerobacillus alkaliphilus TaxID=1548597 RepID=A0A4V1LGK4_9BACI|nr:Gfo/Idh/MocA family oxidoreductase [Anaerobacillus alkaliphilus]RXJ02032.1 gfo/Idh/MocA family oxidoreductase [Anaerobacillus alkaliphilus]